MTILDHELVLKPHGFWGSTASRKRHIFEWRGWFLGLPTNKHQLTWWDMFLEFHFFRKFFSSFFNGFWPGCGARPPENAEQESWFIWVFPCSPSHVENGKSMETPYFENGKSKLNQSIKTPVISILPYLTILIRRNWGYLYIFSQILIANSSYTQRKGASTPPMHDIIDISIQYDQYDTMLHSCLTPCYTIVHPIWSIYNMT